MEQITKNCTSNFMLVFKNVKNLMREKSRNMPQGIFNTREKGRILTQPIGRHIY